MRRRGEKGNEIERADTMGTNIYSAKDNQSLHKSLNGEFILYQILLQQILNGNQSLKKDQSSLYEYFQPENENDQRLMKEFDHDYHQSKAIFWYTRESPVYKILNKALRTQNIDDLIPFGQFINDLNQQLSTEQIPFIKKQNSLTIKVYRGQFISKDEVKRLKSSQGQLISVNSFLSTSTNRKKALEFATSRSPPTDELTSILLEMTLNLNALSRPYADIKHLSAFPEEEEILFMLGAIFRIDRIEYDEQIHLWNVHLTLASQNDQDYKEYQQSLKQQLNGQNQFVSLGNCFIQMQKYEEAQKHFEEIFQRKFVNDPIELAHAYLGLADVHQKKEDFHSAIENINKSLDCLKKDPSNEHHPLVSQAFNHLAQNYFHLNDYLTAFTFYDKALKTQNNVSSTTYQGLAQIHFQLENYFLSLQYLQKALKEHDENSYASIADIYIQMGRIHVALNDKDKASICFQQATQNQLKCLPETHPDVAYTYIALALMYLQINDRDKAFHYLEKAHQLQSDTLPHFHSDFGQMFKHFGDSYMKYEDFDKALLYYHQSLDNQLKRFQWNHPSVNRTYFTIGSIYRKKKDFDQALIYFHKIVDSELTRTKKGDQSLSIAYQNLADLFYEKQDFHQALNFYQKQLENELIIKLPQHISLVNLYQRIGELFHQQNHLKEALIHYYRLIDCYQNTENSQNMIRDIYQIIEKIYLEKKDFSQRFFLYQQVEHETDKDTQNIYFEKKHLDQTLSHFTKSLQDKLQQRIENNSSSINNNYQILANLSYEKGSFNQSLDYFIQLLNNKIQTKGFVDCSLINLYKIIGKLCFQQEYFNEALICFNRLIDCQRSQQEQNHFHIIETFQSIGNVYLKKDPLHQLSNYFNQLIEKQTTKSNFITFQTDFQFEHRHFNENIFHFHDLLKKKSSKRYFKKDELYLIIANLYLEKQELNQSTIFFEKLLSYQHRKSSSVLRLAKTNEILAKIYQKQFQHHLAFQRFQEALFFYKQIYPINQYLIDHLNYQIQLYYRS